MPRYVVDVPLGAELMIIPDKSGATSRVEMQTLPDYVAQISVHNLNLSEELSRQKDFVRDVCHVMGITLAASFDDILNRLKRHENEVQRLIKVARRHNKLQELTDDYADRLDRDNFIKLEQNYDSEE